MIDSVKELDQALKPLYDLMHDIWENVGSLDKAQISELSSDLTDIRGILKGYIEN
jgi:hypothetical protein